MHNLFLRYSLRAVLFFVLLFCFTGSFAFAADQADSATKQPAAEIKTPDTEDKKEIIWNTYKDGLAQANAENKKVFLHFFTNKCHYCRVMQKETFVDKKVISLLNDKFVSIKVNLAKDPSLGKEYPAPGVPMSWFLESAGGKIGGRPGYLPPDQFVNMLQFVLNEEYKK